MKFLWDHDTRKRTISNIVVVIVGISFCFLLLNLDKLHSGLNFFMTIVTPFIYGFVLAYLLTGPVKFFERTWLKKLEQYKYLRRYRRPIAIILAMGITVFVLGALLSVVVPQLIDSMFMLVNNIQRYLGDIDVWMRELLEEFPVEISNEVYKEILAAWKTILNISSDIMVKGFQYLLGMTGQLTSSLLNIFVAVIVSIYLLTSKEKFFAQITKTLYACLPKHIVEQVLSVGALTNKIFNGFINGKIIDSAIIGVLCFACLTILKMPYALLVSVIVGITNIIPFFGPFIGAVPSMFIIFIVDPFKALLFLAFIFLLQQFDGNILGPKILGNSTGLPAIWVLFAILVGGGLAGFVGMLIGVPTFAVIYALLKNYLERRLEEKGLSKQTEDYSHGYKEEKE